jgi:hypothetical protein
LDWESANKRGLPPHDPQPGEEISEISAKEDQEFLAKRAAARKKRTKYVRSSPRERAIRERVESPETVQERRLRTILAALSHGKSLFEARASDDLTGRLFQRNDVKLRVRIDPAMRRQLIAFSPGEPQAFEWVTVSIAPGALEDRYAGFVVGRLNDVIASQNQLRRLSNA